MSQSTSLSRYQPRPPCPAFSSLLQDYHPGGCRQEPWSNASPLECSFQLGTFPGPPPAHLTHTCPRTAGSRGLQKALGAGDIVVLYQACASSTCSGFWTLSLVLEAPFQIARHLGTCGGVCFCVYVRGVCIHVNADRWTDNR